MLWAFAHAAIRMSCLWSKIAFSHVVWAVRNYGLRLPHVSLIFHQLQGIVRPEFTGTLAVKSGRHPVLEGLHSAGTVVPNDVYCDDSSSFQMIYGPKSAANAIAYVVQRSLTDGHFSTMHIVCQVGQVFVWEIIALLINDAFGREEHLFTTDRFAHGYGDVRILCTS
jgi:hypothetical protein